MARRRATLTERQQESLRILRKNGWNVNAAARELGIKAPTMFAMVRRLREHGVSA